MDRRVRLRIRYERRSGLVALLALALLAAAFVGYLAWGQGQVAASGPQAPLDHARVRPLAASTGMRGYYLTATGHGGAGALTACADGYHFASLWEIMDPSHLKYDTTLGDTNDDSGQGPYTARWGWVRTGYDNSTSSTAGQGNCDGWISSDDSEQGTGAYLPANWTAGQDIHVWRVGPMSCDTKASVWCVADDVSAPIYLPIILKNSS
jgi:hypothetical protein